MTGDLSALSRMTARLTHRGPDEHGAHVDAAAAVGLAARRLGVIDPLRGHQPVGNEDGSVWAVLDGEIYNRPALQRHLRARGHRLASRVDTEVLVHLYEEFGEAMVHCLEGAYALAVWDRRRQRLLLARDRFGERPLFHASPAGGLVFASELWALSAGLPATPDVHPAAVDAYLALGHVPAPATLLRGVHQLPPGHLLCWERPTGRTRVSRYWRLADPAGDASASRGELVAETHRLLSASVRSRMDADVPVGVLLDGGIGSTLAAALAADGSRGHLRTFAVAGGPGHAGAPAAARRAARAIGSEHTEMTLTGDDVAERAPRILRALDQPIADPVLVPLHAIAELARREVRVAIGGGGADGILGGEGGCRLPSRADPWRRCAGGVGGWRARPPDRLHGPALAGRRLDDDEDGLAGAPTLSESRGEAAGRSPDLHGAGGRAEVLLSATHRAGTQVSLEVRMPYLHRELVEFAASVPAHVRCPRRGATLLASVLEQVLPAAPRRRRPSASVPAGRWLRGPLAPLVEAQLRRGPLVEEGWVDRERMAACVREHLAGARDRSRALWPLLALGLWLDRLRSGDER
jgi:asparagine synthase (glutamine-hydrolysing)